MKAPKGGSKKKQKQQSAHPKDFEKVRQKVGKRKVRPHNELQTAVKAKPIAVPTQSVLLDKGDETTARQQNLQDLIAQVRHHNFTTRRNAIQGIRELLTKYPHALRSRLGMVLQETACAAVDEDATVRRNYRLFLEGVLTHTEGEGEGEVVAPATAAAAADLSAYGNLLSAYLKSCLTHVRRDIREEGSEILELYVRHRPALIRGLLHELPALLCGLLEGSARTHTVLACLHRVLEQQLDNRGPTAGEPDHQREGDVAQLSLQDVISESWRIGGSVSTLTTHKQGGPPASDYNRLLRQLVHLWLEQQPSAATLAEAAVGGAKRSKVSEEVLQRLQRQLKSLDVMLLLTELCATRRAAPVDAAVVDDLTSQIFALFPLSRVTPPGVNREVYQQAIESSNTRLAQLVLQVTDAALTQHTAAATGSSSSSTSTVLRQREDQVSQQRVHKLLKYVRRVLEHLELRADTHKGGPFLKTQRPTATATDSPHTSSTISSSYGISARLQQVYVLTGSIYCLLYRRLPEAITTTLPLPHPHSHTDTVDAPAKSRTKAATEQQHHQLPQLLAHLRTHFERVVHRLYWPASQQEEQDTSAQRPDGDQAHRPNEDTRTDADDVGSRPSVFTKLSRELTQDRRNSSKKRRSDGVAGGLADGPADKRQRRDEATVDEKSEPTGRGFVIWQSSVGCLLLTAALQGVDFRQLPVSVPPELMQLCPGACRGPPLPLVSRDGSGCGGGGGLVSRHRWPELWPKLLFYLKDTNPPLSELLLALVLHMCRDTTETRASAQQLRTRLLVASVPFLVGSNSSPPVVVGLPLSTQLLAVAFVPHLLHMTKMPAALLARLAALVVVGEAGAGRDDGHVPVLHRAARELLVEAVVGIPVCSALPMEARLQFVMTILHKDGQSLIDGGGGGGIEPLDRHWSLLRVAARALARCPAMPQVRSAEEALEAVQNVALPLTRILPDGTSSSTTSSADTAASAPSASGLLFLHLFVTSLIPTPFHRLWGEEKVDQQIRERGDRLVACGAGSEEVALAVVKACLEDLPPPPPSGASVKQIIDMAGSDAGTVDQLLGKLLDERLLSSFGLDMDQPNISLPNDIGASACRPSSLALVGAFFTILLATSSPSVPRQLDDGYSNLLLLVVRMLATHLSDFNGRALQLLEVVVASIVFRSHMVGSLALAERSDDSKRRMREVRDSLNGSIRVPEGEVYDGSGLMAAGVGAGGGGEPELASRVTVLTGALSRLLEGQI